MSPAPSPSSPISPRLLEPLRSEGYAVVASSSLGLDPAEAARAPWAFAERLFGQRPRMVERQPIRPVPGGRSFASTSAPCPLHTDSQMFGGRPPHAQIMVCLRQASRGGESLLLDAWALAKRLEREAPSLFARLFDQPRRMPFVFGDVFGPTLGLRAGDLVFTHPPVVPHGDTLAEELARSLARAEPTRVGVEAGSVMVVDNHRMLHGREGFDDPGREFTRLLVWLPSAIADEPSLRSRAEPSRARLDGALSGPLSAARASFGLVDPVGPVDAAAEARLSIVLEMLRGTPPGVLAQRHGVAEPELYRMRDLALARALGALTDGALSSDERAAARKALEALGRGR